MSHNSVTDNQSNRFQNIPNSFKVTAQPALLISSDDMKLHLRISGSQDDALVLLQTLAATAHAEKVTSSSFVTQTILMAMDRFPNDEIRIPRSPLILINSIKYIDTDGVQITWPANEYKVDTISKPGRIRPVFGLQWPAARREINSVEIDYDAGYGLATAVPDPIVAAVKLICGHLFENRENSISGTIMKDIPTGALDLLAPFTIWE